MKLNIRSYTMRPIICKLDSKLYRVPKRKKIITKAINHILNVIDIITFENEGKTTKEYLTSRKYETLKMFLSFVIEKGYCTLTQEKMAYKIGVSHPIINELIKWLEEIEICQQIKTVGAGRRRNSFYILTLHPNYLYILEYFRTEWYFPLEMNPLYSKYRIELTELL
ncbi:hypothetical protein SAMN04488168_12325 [Bacillus sp. 491mf]|uniref:hypothetical protein n=1 Tax=Bacillus sp. 491mf TaxID=1761755 RepID=UPI0008DF3E0B|nr:hypothetical protein [Bacillus sp. 491mf]SFD18199.1 hypothetical protein SAMN04488168_12325 [Bacillus sp. 491mf]